KNKFIKEIYEPREFRKITKSEACLIQGFPHDFKLPESRARWMKLIGNSVSVPVIDKLCKAIINTGVFHTSNL
ncbi:MAG: DNA cytosine methyltransferase, partial [Dolichospermum sp.]